MERDVLISKAGVDYGAGLTLATGGFWTSDTMTEGAIAVFNKDQSVVDGSDPVVAADITGDSIYIGAMGLNGIRMTTEISRSSFKYVKRAYVAPVAAVKVLGNETTGSTTTYGSLNLPATINVGDIVGVTIRDRSKPHEDNTAIINYSFAVVTGDLLTGTTSVNIIAKLVALINANNNSVVTALAQTDGTDNDAIKFTAKTAGSDFDIIPMDGVLKNANVLQYKELDGIYTSGLSTTVVANNPGTGTSAQALVAEKDSSIREGQTNAPHTTRGNLYTAASNVVDGATYVVYSLYYNMPMDSPLSKGGNFEQLAQIFVPSGETGTGEAITVLDDIFALVNP